MADPANLFCRNTGNKGMGRHIFNNRSASRNKGILPERDAEPNRRVGANSSPALDNRGLEDFLARDKRSRISNIGENARRSAKDAIFKNNAVINAHVVLY